MEWLTGARVALTPSPARRRFAPLEAALLGHCPGRVRLERLRAMPHLLDEMRAAGLGTLVDALLADPALAAFSQLFHVPLPLRGGAEFHDIFPDAATSACTYESRLAGRRAWLPQAVDDYFANGGEKLWIVHVPEAEGQSGFMPADAVLHDPSTLRGLACVLALSSVGVVGMPDLERLQVPASLPDRPTNLTTHPDPQFLPCTATEVEASSEEAPSPSAATIPLPIEVLLRSLLALVLRYRPDVQLLWTLPLEYSASSGSPTVSGPELQRIREIRDSGSAHVLRHVQFLFPYLRGSRYALRSAVGAIAGKQAAIARSKGPWHSIGGAPLVSDGSPYPRLSRASQLALRAEPGVGVLELRSGFAGRAQLSLDDERLVVPALPPTDYIHSQDRAQLDGMRAAEVMRFLGFLRRQLQALGDRLVFDVDVNDPRPLLVLKEFFDRLYRHGALRGRVAEDAYRIRKSHPNETAIQFDIEIAPAFPIDRIFLTFTNLDGEWQTNGVRA